MDSTALGAATVLGWYVTGVSTLLPIVNPLSTVPLMLALTNGQPESEIRRIARRAPINAGIIMVVSLVLGAGILEFFGISIAALRIAGGLVVAQLGFRMLMPNGDDAPSASTDGRRAGNVELIPLGFPSLSGAGTLAVIIAFSAQIRGAPALEMRLVLWLVGLAVIATIVLLSMAVLRHGAKIMRRLGEGGAEAVTRIMGLLMICIGIQFIAVGVEAFVKEF